MSGSNAIWTTLMSVPLFALVVDRLRQIPMAKLRASLLVIIVFWLLFIVAEITWLAAPVPELRPLEPINNSVATQNSGETWLCLKNPLAISKMVRWCLSQIPLLLFPSRGDASTFPTSSSAATLSNSTNVFGLSFSK